MSALSRFTRACACAGLVALLAGTTACGRRESERAEPAVDDWLTWPAREGARSYVVQAWSDARLLFEESSSDTTLELSSSLRRAMAPFEDVRLEVRAVDAGGEWIGEPWVTRTRPSP